MEEPPVPACPCCRHRTGCATCPVCFWTDDGQTFAPDGPNGDLTLAEARLNYALYGASRPRYAEVVRAGRPDEAPG